MIISNSHKYIFIHIPKTAGTSITRLLDSNLRWNDLILGGTPYGEKISPVYRERFGLWKHSDARQVLDVVGEKIWSSYFTFAVVREPYQRLASLYTYSEKLTKRIDWKANIQRYMGHKGIWQWDFIRAYLESKNFSEFIRNDRLIQSKVARPMSNFVEDENGQVVIDTILKMEELDTDLARIADRIGVDTQNLSLSNKSKSRTDALGFYYKNNADYKHVTDMYARDFEIFGYDSI